MRLSAVAAIATAAGAQNELFLDTFEWAVLLA
jgi:hypothetical protein